MDSALEREMTLAEFLPWAQAQETRHEFDGGTPVAMIGAGRRHNRLQIRLSNALRSRVSPLVWEILGPDAGILTVGDTLRYPDVVVCPAGLPDEGFWFEQPAAVFEIVSPGSSRTDRVIKLREYQSVETIRRYVILEQDGGATDFSRGLEGAFVARGLTELDILDMPEIGISLPLSEIFPPG